MPKMQTQETAAAAVVAAEPPEPARTRKYDVKVLDDGRVRGTVIGIHEDTDELNYACSPERTVKFMLNDVAPEIE